MATSTGPKISSRTTVSGFTQLGLVEMTRKRTRESLAHMLCQPCPTCEGRGQVKTARSVCYDVLREILPGTVPVIFGRAAGRPDEKIVVMPLSDADPLVADMATCVIIGSLETRIIARGDRPGLVYTPRFMTGASR